MKSMGTTDFDLCQLILDIDRQAIFETKFIESDFGSRWGSLGHVRIGGNSLERLPLQKIRKPSKVDSDLWLLLLLKEADTTACKQSDIISIVMIVLR